MTSWDESFDFVIVGSGGGGLVAGLAAADAGLKPVIIEKQDFVGGSTAMSGGVVWMPNNPLMQAEGVPDSYEAGMDYLESVVGPPDEGSSLATAACVFDQRPRDAVAIAAQGGPSGSLRGLQRLLRQPKGRQRPQPVGGRDSLGR